MNIVALFLKQLFGVGQNCGVLKILKIDLLEKMPVHLLGDFLHKGCGGFCPSICNIVHGIGAASIQRSRLVRRWWGCGCFYRINA